SFSLPLSQKCFEEKRHESGRRLASIDPFQHFALVSRGGGARFLPSRAQMAGENGTAVVSTTPSALNSVEKAQQGKVTGVIQPPPDIRAIVDKTARFVAKNGKSFETRILSSDEGKSAKFNFMRPHDPFYAYYEFKIREFEESEAKAGAAPSAGAPSAVAPTPAPAREGEAAGADAGEAAGEEAAEDGLAAGGEAGKAKPAAVAGAPSALQRKAVMAPIAKAAKSIDKDRPPPPFEFSAGHPTGLTAQEVDLIKLTAQYTAAGGRAFLGALAQREARNEQFQFLKHTHALFSYFTSLVDAYAKVLQPTAAQRDAVDAGRDRMKVLERAVHRWEHTRAAAEKTAAAVAEADAERVAFRSIDWHDFVVVTTVDFPEDEVIPVDYPEAETPERAAGETADAAGAGRRPGAGAAVDADGDIDMDVEMEVEEGPAAVSAVTAPSLAADDLEGIRVVEDYRPAVATAGDNVQLPDNVIDPITGRIVPVSELSDHMRVQLLDPKWREDQRRAQEKQRDTAVADGDAIAASLSRFARRRGDIFGTAEEEAAAANAESERRRQRMEETNRIMWDGHFETANAAKEAARLVGRQAPPPASAPPPGGRAIGPSATPAPRVMPAPPPQQQHQPPPSHPALPSGPPPPPARTTPAITPKPPPPEAKTAPPMLPGGAMAGPAGVGSGSLAPHGSWGPPPPPPPPSEGMPGTGMGSLGRGAASG
ncbi:unnamed protein product, partial [Phaeothamnion confervicola]